MNQQQKQLNTGKPVMWTERIGNELFVYHNGELIYKRWYKKNSTEKKASILLNKYFPNEWIS